MELKTEKLPKSKIKMEIELSKEEFDGFMDKAASKISEKIEVKGFRKGNVPKNIVEEKVGKESILIEAGDLAVQDSYKKAVLQAMNEENIEPISHPEIKVKKIAAGNPFIFEAVAQVLPQIDLPDYKKIASGVKKEKIKVEEKEVEETLKWLESNAKNKDELKKPENFRGKIEDAIRTEKEIAQTQRVRNEILTKIAEKSKMEIPDILIKRETFQMLENFKENIPKRLDISFEEYLKKNGKTEDQIKEMLAEQAEKKVKNFLILREIGKKENIEVSEEEIKEHPKQQKDYVREVIKTEKIFKLLENLTRYQYTN